MISLEKISCSCFREKYKELPVPNDLSKACPGHLLFLLKLHQRKECLSILSESLFKRITESCIKFDCIVPVPHTEVRDIQPVPELCKGLSALSGKPVIDCLHRTKQITPLKLLQDKEAREREQSGSLEIDKELLSPFTKILLVDDIYRTGATVNECQRMLSKNGIVAQVAVIVRIREHQVVNNHSGT